MPSQTGSISGCYVPNVNEVLMFMLAVDHVTRHAKYLQVCELGVMPLLERVAEEGQVHCLI